MIVKPISDNSYPEFINGKTYVVLSVEFQPEDVFFRILASDERGPALYPSSSFVEISGALSPYWVILKNRGKWRIGPKEWYRIGFWERYFDGEKESVATFNRIAKKIIRESNSLSSS